MTSDPRLDRIPHQDPRSRAFRAVTPRLAKKPLRSYTWRIITAPVLDQGNEGACTGFCLAGELAARPVERQGVDNSLAQRIYWQAQGVDRAEGRHYEDGATMLAAAKAGQRAGYFTGYRWAFGLQETLLVVGYRGPVMLGIDWHEAMYEPRDGVVRVDGPVVGGHAILARAVSLPRQAVLLRNSWGAGWGVNGDAWLSFADLDRLLRANGEVVIPEGRR